MNTIGTALRVTIFGSSHGPGIGCVLDGVPAGIEVDLDDLQREVDLRRPSGALGTPRQEADRVELLAGTKDGSSTGAPIVIFIANGDTDSSKYEKFKVVPRPGHADLTALRKYGASHDIRGGGQFSGRMTAPLVAAGAVAKEMLRSLGVQTAAYTQRLGKVVDEEDRTFKEVRRAARENPVRAADPAIALDMIHEIMEAKEEGDSVGGVVRCLTLGLPIGVGEPFFDTLEGELAKMIFAIPGVKGVEFGVGFRAAEMRGSEHNDIFTVVNGDIQTVTNNAGGVLGGLSNSMPLDFKVAFKPTASISMEQRSVDLERMEDTTIKVEGRHDPCIVPRAVVVVEAATALVLADLCLRGDFIA
ncbi:chorismate synthase [Methanomassiliicoccus luminyensis]|uniref:chorismate synthase n=1 Tax=Methanomassiliicoccus luminyensis TaxID=1080712 RepID=UPI00036693FA|nr:chorismate synthase [Methanomassiliicoccus luminyensis]